MPASIPIHEGARTINDRGESTGWSTFTLPGWAVAVRDAIVAALFLVGAVETVSPSGPLADVGWLPRIVTAAFMAAIAACIVRQG
ncbi:hypothetical protein PJK45_21445 [Mycobacterium kansasii]